MNKCAYKTPLKDVIDLTGLARNTAKLFSKDDRLLIVALDHPQSFGAMEGLEKPLELIEKLSESKADGFIVNPGLVKLLDPKTLADKKLVIRASLGGSKFSDYKSIHPVVVSAETLVNLGADAAILMLVLGKEDYDSMENVASAIDQYHSLSIPVIVEVLAEDFGKTSDPELVRSGARIAAELGADVVKVFYSEKFANVVESCPIPVLLAGGPKSLDVFTMAKNAVDGGAKGYAFGRNVFQSEDPLDLLAKLDRILRR